MDRTRKNINTQRSQTTQMRNLKTSAKVSPEEASKAMESIRKQVKQEALERERKERHQKWAAEQAELREQQKLKEVKAAREEEKALAKAEKKRDAARKKMESAKANKKTKSKRVSGSGDDYFDNLPQSPRKKKKGLIIGIVIFLLLVIIGAVVGYGVHALAPVGGDETTVYFTVKEGDTISGVATALADQGLIRDARIFKLYARFLDGGEIQAGKYALNKNLSSQDIMTKMATGDIVKGEIKVTFPEGTTLAEMAAILEEKGICSADAFKKEAAQVKKHQKSYPLLASIPEGRNLEGYLFPATYIWDKKTDPAKVIDEMLDTFVNKISEEDQAQMKEQSLSVDEVVIMAAIIQQETRFDDEMPTIASVLYNRMEAGMPLQCDSTVDYVLGRKHISLTTEETKVDSPYNTYVNYGLPFGPICNPGMSAIKAALYPEKTDYLYFVSDLKTGKTYFNTTLEDHERDVAIHMGD